MLFQKGSWKMIQNLYPHCWEAASQDRLRTVCFWVQTQQRCRKTLNIFLNSVIYKIDQRFTFYSKICHKQEPEAITQSFYATSCKEPLQLSWEIDSSCLVTLAGFPTLCVGERQSLSQLEVHITGSSAPSSLPLSPLGGEAFTTRAVASQISLAGPKESNHRLPSLTPTQPLGTMQAEGHFLDSQVSVLGFLRLFPSESQDFTLLYYIHTLAVKLSTLLQFPSYSLTLCDWLLHLLQGLS